VLLQKKFPLNLHFNIKVVIFTIATTLLLMIDHYFPITPLKELDRIILYLVIPLGIIIFGFRESPRAYGFQFGNWRLGLAITLGALIVMMPILWFTVKWSPAMQSYYTTLSDYRLPLLTAMDLVGWEFVFRGFLLFGYMQAFGDDALWMQSVPFALAHLGKPPIETFSTLFGGVLFGIVAKKTESFVYPFIIHFFIAYSVSLFSIYQGL